MIIGIGIDLINVARVEEIMKRTQGRFAKRILGREELLIYETRHLHRMSRGQTYLATRFAAKEAFSKAVGLGKRTPINWHSVQILSTLEGAPKIILSGGLAEWVDKQHLHFHISITDEQETAVVLVIGERN